MLTIISCGRPAKDRQTWKCEWRWCACRGDLYTDGKTRARATLATLLSVSPNSATPTQVPLSMLRNMPTLVLRPSKHSPLMWIPRQEPVGSAQLMVDPTNTHTVTIPQYGSSITLNGHQSKIIVTDFAFGSKLLVYSTAEVLTYAIIDGQEVLALWVPTGESGEFTIKGANSAKVVSGDRYANLKITPGKSNVTVSFLQNAGMTILDLGGGSKVVLLDRSAAYLFWSPALDNNPLEAGNNTCKFDERWLHLLDSNGTQYLFKDLTSSVPLLSRAKPWNWQATLPMLQPSRSSRPN